MAFNGRLSLVVSKCRRIHNIVKAEVGVVAFINQRIPCAVDGRVTTDKANCSSFRMLASTVHRRLHFDAEWHCRHDPGSMVNDDGIVQGSTGFI